jgi:hypothetical protein
MFAIAFWVGPITTVYYIGKWLNVSEASEFGKWSYYIFSTVLVYAFIIWFGTRKSLKPFFESIEKLNK